MVTLATHEYLFSNFMTEVTAAITVDLLFNVLFALVHIVDSVHEVVCLLNYVALIDVWLV